MKDYLHQSLCLEQSSRPRYNSRSVTTCSDTWKKLLEDRRDVLITEILFSENINIVAALVHQDAKQKTREQVLYIQKRQHNVRDEIYRINNRSFRKTLQVFTEQIEVLMVESKILKQVRLVFESWVVDSRCPEISNSIWYRLRHSSKTCWIKSGRARTAVWLSLFGVILGF